MLKPWCIHRHQCQQSHTIFYHWEYRLVWKCNPRRSKSAGNIDRKPELQLKTELFPETIRKQQVYLHAHTALMPFSCCAALRSMMVRSCQRALRSAKSSQGFLALTPFKLFFSFSMSSHSASQSAIPCSCFRAVHRETHGVYSLLDTCCFFSSDQATGSAGESHVSCIKLVSFNIFVALPECHHMLLTTAMEIIVSASGDSREKAQPFYLRCHGCQIKGPKQNSNTPLL